MILELFYQNFMAIVQILSISAIGYIIFKKNILPHHFVKDLATFTIYVTLPFLLITKVSAEFNMELLTSLIFIPIVMLFLFIMSSTTVWLLAELLSLEKRERRFHMALGTFMNTVYLPLGMISFILPSELHGYGVFVVTMCLFVSTPLMWSVGVHWIKYTPHSRADSFQKGNFFSVPFVAMIIGLIIGTLKHFLGISTDHFLFQNPVFYGLEQLGQLTTPLALFVLGGMLAGVGNIFKPSNIKGLMIVLVTRLIIIPGFLLMLMLFFKNHITFEYYLGLILIVEAAAPPATSMSVISRHHNAYVQETSTILIITYLTCILTIPVWMTFYSYFFS